MDDLHLTKDWSVWSALLRAQFPLTACPDTAPQGTQWTDLTARFALDHDLTTSEVAEVLEDLSFSALAPATASKAA